MKTIILLLLPLFSISQKYEVPKFKQYIPSALFTFLAGASDGLRDAAMFRFDGKGQFWNGKQSMNNKYKNGDINQGAAYFGSTSFLVFTTDGAHLSNAFTHQFQAWSFVFAPYDDNRKFGHLLLKGIAFNAVRQAGHTLVYDLIFKP